MADEPLHSTLDIRHSTLERLAVILSLVVPGAGLVLLNRVRAGLMIGVVFSAALNSALGLGLLSPGTAPRWALWLLGIAAGLAWGASAGLTAYVAARRLPRHTAAERERLFREGVTAYLRGDQETAARTFRAILHLCPSDVEAHLKLAMVAKARGRRREAAAELRRCRYHDEAGTWRAEIERELAELETDEGH